MSFASITFIVFFAIVLLILSLTEIPKKVDLKKLRHIILLIASYIFYAWWDWRFCFLMLALTMISFFAALRMDGKHRKIAIVIGVVVPLVILGIFKYYNFFLESFRALFGISAFNSLNIILPVGISFYTFQSMSYTIDVYRHDVEPAGFIEVALYISFFPQLVAGPIVKAKDFLPQLRESRKVTLCGLEEGLQIFVFGMFKKIVLADRLSVFVDDVFATPEAFSSLTVILAVVAYALQIYFDFSGYSDMAIGCAKCLGYDLRRNFNLPYLSKNPTEFWKRWHISLSSWLKEYLYIPLGGNRKGKCRTYFNLMVTMLLGGLWHGASWTFVFWGLLHGVGLCVHKSYRQIRGDKKSMPGVVAIILNTIFVSLCWVFFRSETFGVAKIIFRKIFVWEGGVRQIYFWLIIALIVETIYLIWCRVKTNRIFGTDNKNGIQAFYLHHNLNTVVGLSLFFFEIMMVIGLAYTGGNPFIYFQF